MLSGASRLPSPQIYRAFVITNQSRIDFAPDALIPRFFRYVPLWKEIHAYIYSTFLSALAAAAELRCASSPLVISFSQHISAAFYATNVFLNVFLTAMIIIKLLPTRRNFNEADGIAKHASSVIGMLAESAAPIHLLVSPSFAPWRVIAISRLSSGRYSVSAR
jgi:hypothetical protein